MSTSPLCSSSLSLALAALTLLPAGVAAHDNGMDMSMDGSMTLTAGQMLPYLHFTPGDMLWFLGWVPASAGAMVGACVAFVLLGVVERWIAASRAVMRVHWARRAEIIRANRLNAAQTLPAPASSTAVVPDLKKQVSASSFASLDDVHASALAAVYDKAVRFRGAPPFVLEHDAVRGILHAGHAALQYALMLAVMTFQVAFILSLIVGLGIGEALFGRYASHAEGHS